MRKQRAPQLCRRTKLIHIIIRIAGREVHLERPIQADLGPTVEKRENEVDEPRPNFVASEVDEEDSLVARLFDGSAHRRIGVAAVEHPPTVSVFVNQVAPLAIDEEETCSALIVDIWMSRV